MSKKMKIGSRKLGDGQHLRKFSLLIAASATSNVGETFYQVMEMETAEVIERAESTNDGKPHNIFARRVANHYPRWYN
jgi:hypothetical protein